MKDLLYLSNIAESIIILENYIKNKSVHDLESSIILRDAVCKRVEEIGENMNKVSLKTKKANPEIKWQDFIDTRNFLTHVYQMVNLHKLWNILKKELPLLKKQINNIKKEIK